MKRILNPPLNVDITFMEPFLHNDNTIIVRIYGVNTVIRIVDKQHKEVIRELLDSDLKLTQAIVNNDQCNQFSILRHSPQSDFFKEVI
jgi:hypothetical protein